MAKNNKKKDIPAVDIWDASVPSEVSSYVSDDHFINYNVDNLGHNNGALTMIDLFCGAGGFSVGASWAGFTPVLGIDHFKPAIETWSFNHPNAIACLGDIRQIDPNEYREILARRGINHINLLTGGVPCQGFSLANRKHNDADARNFLYLEYMRFVEVFEPDYIILENVSGLRMRLDGQFEENIKADMRRLGYEPSVQILNAAAYGVPQVRQRLLFVGVRRGIGLNERYEFPEPIIDNPNNYLTVGDALSDLPLVESGQSSEVYNSRPHNEYQRLMRGVGGLNIGRPDRLYNHCAPNHPQDTINMIANTTPGEPMYERFKQRIRLSLEKPSPTQLAGGIRPSFQFGHPTIARGLTIRERARLQSFPDSYIFKGGIVQERVQTGNAVPPLLIYNVVRSIARDLEHYHNINNI